MHILAISGSLRAVSTNAALIRIIAGLASEDMEITIYDGLADIPPFNPDNDGDNTPAVVSNLRQLLQAVDGVVICTPEYGFGVPGVLKNMLDWLVSTGELSGKPVATISSSSLPTGGDKALASLLQTMAALGARMSVDGKLMIPTIGKKLNANGDILDPTLTLALKSVLAALALLIEA